MQISLSVSVSHPFTFFSLYVSLTAPQITQCIVYLGCGCCVPALVDMPLQHCVDISGSVYGLADRGGDSYF